MALHLLPNVATFSSLSDEDLGGTLDLLFEPSVDLHALAIPTMRSITFASYEELIETLRDELMTIQKVVHPDPTARKPLLSILGSHPRLGEKKVESAQSAAEQAQLQASEGSGEAENLAKLNREYEAKFPGLRYVVFVNGRPRDVIMANMRERIARGNMAQEEVEAIQVRCRPRTLLELRVLTTRPRLCVISQRTGPPSCRSRQASNVSITGQWWV